MSFNLPVTFNKLYYTINSSNNEKIVFDDAILKSNITGEWKDASSNINTKAFLVHKGDASDFKPFIYAKSTNGVFNFYQKDNNIGVTYTSDSQIEKNKSTTDDDNSITYKNIIMNEEGGAEFCSTVKVDKITLDYNEETKSLDFIFK